MVQFWPLDAVVIFAPEEPAVRLALDLYLSSVQCGFPSPAEDFIRARLDLNELVVQHPAATFYVRAVGNSMAPSIYSGDLLIVDKSLTNYVGRVVVAVVNGQFTVKRVLMRDGTPSLISDNAKYPPIDLGDGSDVTIWGVVTHVLHKP
jgi:DNA polymerase V